jgi:exopolysaccharide biosynthesis polyprenyl glycosylphosphotransferase
MILYAHLEKQNQIRKFVDFFILFLCWPISFYIRFDLGIFELLLGEDSFSRYIKLSPLILLSYVAVFGMSGFYKRSLEKRRIWDENFDIIRTHALAFGTFLALAYVIDNHRYSRITLGVYFFIVPFSLALGRSLVRKYGRKIVKFKKEKVKTILISDNEQKHSTLKQIQHHPEWMIEVLHTIAPEKEEQIKQTLLKEKIDLLLINQSLNSNFSIETYTDTFNKSLCEIIYLPNFGIQSFIQPQLISFGNVPALALNSSDMFGFSALVKRLFDICFAVCFLILFSPVYLICALLVKFTSLGPIFYKQERMGLDGKKFMCIKFRGMYQNAEKNSGPKWATKNDNRTTPVGKWLRKTSLDEIPQFWNVLRGDMSVVGPRPERPVFVENFKHQVPGYMLRHKVKAGITGWAQINGWRGDTSLEKRIECDLWYVQNWSLWLDLKICLMTPFKGLVHPNAY